MIDTIKSYYDYVQVLYTLALFQADKRVDNWLLMQSYTPTLLLTLGYLVVVWAGMKLMKNREPFNFRITLFLYNMGLVGLNSHIFYQVFVNTWKLNYNYVCQPVDYSDNPLELNVAKALWWYYFSKLIEFLDTIFFIARKKFKQVSFLHVYHHATMFPIWWIGIKWVPGGQSFFGALINSFIHIVMYTYYGVSALGPEYQKYLWWKKYLTLLQLLQFFIGMVYASQSLYWECNYPRWMLWAGLVYGVTIIALFINFYMKAYIVKTIAIQFIAGMAHSSRSLYAGCDFPRWMQWALVFYGFSIFCLFVNFYTQAYSHPKTKKPHSNGTSVANGYVTANGCIEHKKLK